VLGGFAVGEIRRLIRLVQKTGIGELELTSGGRTMRISAQGSVHVAPIGSAVVPAGSPGSTPAAGKSGQSPAPAGTAADKYVAITAPMVGTFYRAPAPDADPYVEVGHMVEVGQTVCILEAMKLMNEIEADVRGRVVEILVENAQPVEYGQNLFLVEPV
jgi:acetyl-CoA carboxylase biotin carboxyl carrier protein